MVVLGKYWGRSEVQTRIERLNTAETNAVYLRGGPRVSYVEVMDVDDNLELLEPTRGDDTRSQYRFNGDYRIRFSGFVTGSLLAPRHLRNGRSLASSHMHLQLRATDMLI